MLIQRDNSIHVDILNINACIVSKIPQYATSLIQS